MLFELEDCPKEKGFVALSVGTGVVDAAGPPN